MGVAGVTKKQHNTEVDEALDNHWNSIVEMGSDLGG